MANALNKPNDDTKTIIIHDNAGNTQAPNNQQPSIAPNPVPNAAPNAAPGKFLLFSPINIKSLEPHFRFEICNR